MEHQTPAKKRLSATVYYLLTGIAAGCPGFMATGRLLPAWRHGQTLFPVSLATIHLLVLGCMMTVAFGVLYQIVPIAFRAHPVPRHVLYWHLPLHFLSVAAMVTGFLLTRFEVVGIGGAGLLLSAVAYFWFIGRSYGSAQNKTAVHKGLALPFFALWLVVFVGIFQAFSPGQVTQAVLFTHVMLGGLAFWGGLVLVFSYKLVPMFAVSHGYRASLKRSVALYFTGTVLLVSTPWLQSDPAHRAVTGLGGTILFCGVVSFVVDMVAIIMRKKRRFVLPLYDSMLALGLFALGLTGIAFAAVSSELTWLAPFIYVFAFGGLVPLMFSFMQKMVPFLWFEYRFSKRPERKSAPAIDDMVPKVTAQIGMILYFLGFFAGFLDMTLPLALGVLPVFSWLSACCLTVGSVLVFVALFRVLRIGGTRPQDETT